MLHEDFEKLDLAEIATLLDTLNPMFGGAQFDPVETTIMAAELPFYPGFRLLEIADHTVSPPRERFVLHSPAKSVVLDFTNGPIYALNKELPVVLNEQTVVSYVLFFFTYVRGRHGRFLIAGHVDDINWKEEPPPAARKAIGKMLKTLTFKDGAGAKSGYLLEATMVFKDSLFKSDITVSPEGAVTLGNEELLIEDMPVLDDVFGQ